MGIMSRRTSQVGDLPVFVKAEMIFIEGEQNSYVNRAFYDLFSYEHKAQWACVCLNKLEKADEKL